MSPQDNQAYATPAVLVSTGWVNQRQKEPNVRLVEVDVDTSAYDSGHIAGAVEWNWKEDTQDTLRRPLPSREQTQSRLRRSGISPKTTSVA